MGRHAIVEKLHWELRKGIASEPQVVYTLVEIRKLLEITDRAYRYPALSFHCDWALHSRMDRAGALRILQQFDGFCEKNFQYLKERKLDQDDTWWKELTDTVNVVRFREELVGFLESVHLPRDSYSLNWPEFMRLYAHVITDTPLVIQRRRKSPARKAAPIVIRHLKSVVVKATEDEGGFHLEWKLYYATEPPTELFPCGFTTEFEPEQGSQIHPESEPQTASRQPN